MGNSIVLKYGMDCDADIRLTNAGISWAIDCLLVSGSELAKTDLEKRMIAFLSERTAHS